MDRRGFLIGGLCLGSVATAEVLSPRRKVLLFKGQSLTKAVPQSFEGWTSTAGDIVQPKVEGSLADTLYTQTVGRVYENRSLGIACMLAAAYGETQSDELQLHRPESCYPAVGFNLSDVRTGLVELERGKLPTRELVATSPARREFVTYWTRIGDALPTSGAEQQRVKLRMSLKGIIPDGMLVRCSTIAENAEQGFATNRLYIQSFIRNLSRVTRPGFIGPDLARLQG